MKILVLLLLLDFASAKCKSETSLTSIERTILEYHNLWRSIHRDTPQLCYGESDATHNFTAQAWSEKLEQISKNGNGLITSGNKEVGENSYWSCIGIPIQPRHYQSALVYWYNEVKDVDFVKERTSMGNDLWSFISHYSQVVWSGTREVRCGQARGNNGIFITCQYFPAGNYFDKFDNFVLPLNISAKTQQTMILDNQSGKYKSPYDYMEDYHGEKKTEKKSDKVDDSGLILTQSHEQWRHGKEHQRDQEVNDDYKRGKMDWEERRHYDGFKKRTHAGLKGGDESGKGPNPIILIVALCMIALLALLIVAAVFRHKIETFIRAKE